MFVETVLSGGSTPGYPLVVPPGLCLILNNKRHPETSTIVSLYSSGFSFRVRLLIRKFEWFRGSSYFFSPGHGIYQKKPKNQQDQMKTRFAPLCRMHLPGMAATMALASTLALTSTSARADVVWNVNIGTDIGGYDGAAPENTTSSV